jgi:transposase
VYWATVAMTPRRSGKVCVPAALCLGSRKRNTEHGSGLGRWRWVVERTFACLNQFRRLRVRYEKRAHIHEAFLSLGCALICWRFLRVDWVAE